MLATTFWESFFLFMLFLPLALVWAMALADIVRRDDMSGWPKALWVVCVILVPFLGTLIYLVTRPRVATYEERLDLGDASPQLRHALCTIGRAGGAHGARRPPRPRQAHR